MSFYYDAFFAKNADIIYSFYKKIFGALSVFTGKEMIFLDDDLSDIDRFYISGLYPNEVFMQRDSFAKLMRYE